MHGQAQRFRSLGGLFSFALNEDISVQSFVSDPRPETHFQLPISIEANDELEQLMTHINDIQLNHLEPDKWSFTWGTDQYRTRDYYKFFFREIQPPSYLPVIWKSNCLKKHKVFAWLLLIDRLNTRDMLRRRHLDIGEVFSCLLCQPACDETQNHLFFDCKFSTSCWDVMGIQWAVGLDLEATFEETKRAWGKPIFTELVILGAWNIWKIRNHKLFDNMPQNREDWL